MGWPTQTAGGRWWRIICSMPLKRVQRDLELAVQALKVAKDPKERKALLRKMRELIEEADRLTAKSSN